MSNFGIFILGLATGLIFMALIVKKGRENMNMFALEIGKAKQERRISKTNHIKRKNNRSLRGLMSGSNLTVDKFLEMTREDKELE